MSKMFEIERNILGTKSSFIREKSKLSKLHVCINLLMKGVK